MTGSRFFITLTAITVESQPSVPELALPASLDGHMTVRFLSSRFVEAVLKRNQHESRDPFFSEAALNRRMGITNDKRPCGLRSPDRGPKIGSRTTAILRTSLS